MHSNPPRHLLNLSLAYRHANRRLPGRLAPGREEVRSLFHHSLLPFVSAVKLNMDHTQRVVIDTRSQGWVHSPLPGVERKLLERDGEEVATATSVVRYAPGSAFDAHGHARGEEFLVLEGVFSDQEGDYGPGTYVRNPPGSSHRPSSRDGCTIFVKLRYMTDLDRERVVVDSSALDWRPGSAPGIWRKPLFESERENVALIKFDPGAERGAHRHAGGEEVFVIEGGFRDELGTYGPGTWIRSPHMSGHSPVSDSGCVVFVKTGHLST